MIRILKSILTVTARKSFVFIYRFTKQNLHFSIAIFWVGGKNCIVKNENCIVFPESRYVNLYIAVSCARAPKKFLRNLKIKKT